jgi:uncharacterized membrane protein
LWLLAAVVLIGVNLRTYQLTGRSLWFDEAFSWRLINFPLPEMLARAAADVHPPLYYIILKAWRFIFASSLFSLRMFSVVFAAFTIGASYLFAAQSTKSRPAGLLAATLVALSGFQIQYAWEARMYTLGTALVLLASWLLLKAIREAKAAWWLAYAVAAAACAYVHYFTLFSLAAHAIFVSGYLVAQTRGHLGEILEWRQSWFALGAAAIAAALFAPWLPVFIKQNAQVQENFWIPPIGGWSIPDTFYRMFAPTSLIPQHTGLFWITVAVLPIAATLIGWCVLVFIPRSFPRDGRILTVLLGVVPFAIAVAVSFIGQSLYQDRFFIFAHPFILIGGAILIAGIGARMARRAIITFVLLSFLAASLAYFMELNIPAKPGARAAARTIFEEGISSDSVVVASPFVFFAIDHYATEIYHSPGKVKLYSSDGTLLHFAGAPILKSDDLVGSDHLTGSQSTAVWVVDTTGFGSSPLAVPDTWQAERSEVYPEVFSYQGEVIVTRFLTSP